jgi:formate hydrogenlyase transcriptional activator
VAATNQNLQQLVRERKFRADLYYRLSVFPIMLPPLRERAEDIPLLLQHFVQHFAARYGRCIDCIPAKITDAAMNYHWPGNIRELQNFIERAVVRTRNTELDAPIEELMEAGTPVAGLNTLLDANRAQILATLRQAKGVVGGRNGAAARLGMPRTTLISMMRRLGISIDRAEERTLPSYSYAGTA